MSNVDTKTYLVLGRDKSYFVKGHSDSTRNLSETDIIKTLEFLIDHIFAILGGRVFQQIYGILTVLIVLPFSPTCSFIHARQTPHMVL